MSVGTPSLIDVLSRHTGIAPSYIRPRLDTGQSLPFDHVPTDLIERLLVQETSFFRHAGQWSMLRTMLREDPALSATSLRVWSCGCATGEEAWSLAFLLASEGRTSPGLRPWAASARSPISPALPFQASAVTPGMRRRCCAT